MSLALRTHPGRSQERAPHAVVKYATPIHVLAAFDDAGLSVYAFRLAGRIARRWSPQRGADESVNAMAEACRIDRKTAWKAIGELLERGILRETKRSGQTTRYDFNPVASWSPLDTPEPDTDSTPDGASDPGPTHPTRRDVPPDNPSHQTVRVPVPPDGTQREPIREPIDEDDAATRARGILISMEHEAHLEEAIDQVRAFLASDRPERQSLLSLANRAMKAPLLGAPPDGLWDLLDELPRPLRPVLLVLTARLATTRSTDARLRFASKLATGILDADAERGYAERRPESDTGTGSGAERPLPSPGGAQERTRQAPRRGQGATPPVRGAGVRGTAVQHASTVNTRDLKAGLDEYRARRKAREDADARALGGADPGVDTGDGGGL